MGLIIRKATWADRAVASRWVEGLGWNPGEQDAACLFKTDPAGLFMAEQDGMPIGCATSITYDDHFGFVGGLMVDPAMRRKGPSIMLAIYRHILTHLGERNVGMDAMPSTLKFFCATGCVPSYRHIRMEGRLPGGRTSNTILPLADVPFEAICEYDAAHFPARREHFLRVWLEAYRPGGWACVRNGQLAGWGVLRRARHGWRIGPLQADIPETALELLKAMAVTSGDDRTAMDVPKANPFAMDLVRRLGLVPQFETTRLYSRRAVDLYPARIYSIASYEFG